MAFPVKAADPFIIYIFFIVGVKVLTFPAEGIYWRIHMSKELMQKNI